MPDAAQAGTAPAEIVTALRLVRGMAMAGSALMLIVIAASAYLRLVHAGPCPDGVACEQLAAREGVATAVGVARTAHRLAAGTIAIVLVALVVIANGQRPRLRGQTRLAISGLVVALGLALLGTRMAALAPGATPPAVVVGNLAGGFALLGVLAMAWVGAAADLANATRWAAPPPARAALVLALAAAALAVTLGGLASAGVVGAQEGHRIAGWGTFVLGLAMLAVSRRAADPWRGWRLLVVALLAAQALLGAAQAYVAPSLAMTLGHNLAAAALVAALAATAYRVYGARAA